MILSQIGIGLGAWAVDTGHSGAQLLKLEGGKTYLFYLIHLRKMVTLFYWTLFCTILSALGLFLFGFSVLLSFTNILVVPPVVTGTGAAIFLGSLVVLLVLNSERRWLRFSGVEQMIAEAESSRGRF